MKHPLILCFSLINKVFRWNEQWRPVTWTKCHLNANVVWVNRVMHKEPSVILCVAVAVTDELLIICKHKVHECSVWWWFCSCHVFLLRWGSKLSDEQKLKQLKQTNACTNIYITYTLHYMTSHIYSYSTLYNTDCFKLIYINEQERNSINDTQFFSEER